MKIEFRSNVSIIMVLALTLFFIFLVDNKRKRLTMRDLDRHIFDGKGGMK